MSYVDGFVMAVPTANKERFTEHAEGFDTVFLELGALRVLECWGDEVPDGKVTDFRRAVKAEGGESVVLSWVEWPDKATRDAAMAKMEGLMQSDPRFDQKTNPMPFDGLRMIMGGFTPVVDMKAS
ncbi:MAG: DUF1428 domain-containing protein [Pseudomonadota bacterium]